MSLRNRSKPLSTKSAFIERAKCCSSGSKSMPMMAVLLPPGQVVRVGVLPLREHAVEDVEAVDVVRVDAEQHAPRRRLGEPVAEARLRIEAERRLPRRQEQLPRRQDGPGVRELDIGPGRGPIERVPAAAPDGGVQLAERRQDADEQIEVASWGS